MWSGLAKILPSAGQPIRNRPFVSIWLSEQASLPFDEA
jgi:hypothetical protein